MLYKFIKILTFTVFVSGLTGCGFEPLYVEKKSETNWYFDNEFDTSITNELSQIKIEPIAGRVGQLIKNDLLDNLTPKGEPKTPKYILKVQDLRKTHTKQALRNDITATRERVRYAVDYQLLDAKSRDVLVKGNSISYLSYNIMSNPYSTTFSEKKNEKDAAKILANDITLRMGAYFHSILTKRGDPNEF